MKNKILKNPFLWAFIIGIVFLHFIREINNQRQAPPPPMVIVEDWELIDHNKNNISKKSLEGKVVIANFFFTRCPSICPKLTEKMKMVHEKIDKMSDKITFLSISIDPEHDTPKILTDYAVKHNILKNNWHFLTGKKKDIYQTVIEKMKIHIGEKEPLKDVPGVYDIPHLAHLALFDQNGNLRGLFGTKNQELASLVSAAKILATSLKPL